jgi:hypothetical protein
MVDSKFELNLDLILFLYHIILKIVSAWPDCELCACDIGLVFFCKDRNPGEGGDFIQENV